MHLSVEHGENHATIYLRGEFDTYYVQHLQNEVEELIAGGVRHVILNLRLVRFINSTALGGIIKASKTLAASGGRLVVAKPSPFCRDIIEKVGLDRIVPIFASEEEAVASLATGAPAPRTDEAPQAENESSVLFSPRDPKRIDHFLSDTHRLKSAGSGPARARQAGVEWSSVGRMSSLDETGLHFTWNGGDTDLDPFGMGQLLAIGTELKVRFRLSLFKRGFCEAVATVTEVEERAEGVKVGVAFTKIDKKTLEGLRQYAKDLKLIHDEVRKATGK